MSLQEASQGKVSFCGMSDVGDSNQHLKSCTTEDGK